MMWFGATVNRENDYWWLADRIETEEERKVSLALGLLKFLKTDLTKYKSKKFSQRVDRR